MDVQTLPEVGRVFEVKTLNKKMTDSWKIIRHPSKKVEKDTLIQLNNQRVNAKNEQKRAEEEKEKSELQTKFDKAKATGEKVLIRQFMSNCHETGIDCSYDCNYEYALPDGSVKREYTHCY